MMNKQTRSLGSWPVLAATAAILVACAQTQPEPTMRPPPAAEVEEVVVTASMVRGRRARRARDDVSELKTLDRVAHPLEEFGSPVKPSPLSDASPGEEIWVIVTDQDRAPAARADPGDEPGTGSMLATRIAKKTAPADVEPETIPLPLKHTAVHAVVTGYIATVDVTQQFENPFDEKIEAVYMFPLPEKSAVSEFVMQIGERRIRGILRKREEAEEIYYEARAQGYRASLLTQHRPNIFEQKVANIDPDHSIDVNIRYFHTLPYRDGAYSFVFPTVVGPRYNPPGHSDPVLAVPRQEHEPPSSGTAVRYLRPDERSGHDLSITVELDAAVPIEALRSSHAIRQTRTSADSVLVELENETTIPNKDFVLNFRVAGDTIKSNLLAYADPQTGQKYFTMMLYPPMQFAELRREPMEMVFVLDCSGSMQGYPIEQAKAAVLAALDRLEPDDTFQVIRFSDRARQFDPSPLPATPENLASARLYVRSLSGGGGTRMIEGIRAALGFRHDPERLRFVSFLTDGYIGNEVEIIGAIHDQVGASRIFSFGVGNSVNRYLLERMASEGRGAVAYVGLRDSGKKVMDYFFERVSHPALTDLTVDWGGMDIHDTYPSRLPDLFVGRSVTVTGRFTGELDRPVVRGKAGGRPIDIDVASDGETTDHAFIANLWGRYRIADLADRQAWTPDADGKLAQAITDTALAHSLMSAYTSFVAVDASQVTEGSRGTTVHQAVPVPEGVRYETTVHE